MIYIIGVCVKCPRIIKLYKRRVSTISMNKDIVGLTNCILYRIKNEYLQKEYRKYFKGSIDEPYGCKYLKSEWCLNWRYYYCVYIFDFRTRKCTGIIPKNYYNVKNYDE